MKFLYYLFFVNSVGLLLMYVDKRRAIKHGYRIGEKILLGSSIIGGSIGIWTGMHAFRHKTKKPAFKYGVPIILVIQIILYIVYEINR